MLDIRQEHIPNHSDNIDIQNSESWWNQSKVDILSWWPNTPIELKKKSIYLGLTKGHFVFLPSKQLETF